MLAKRKDVCFTLGIIKLTPTTKKGNTMKNENFTNFLVRFQKGMEIVTKPATNLEEETLAFRKELKRRAKADRAVSGTFEWSFDGGCTWLAAGRG
jgi:hypothetical protein